MVKFAEKDLQKMVVDLAKLCGWLVFHDYDSRYSEPGFPDLCLVRGRRTIFVELKSQDGKIRKEQKTWLFELRDNVAEVYLIRPEHFQDFKQILGPRETDAHQRTVGQPIPDDWDPRLQRKRKVA